MRVHVVVLLLIVAETHNFATQSTAGHVKIDENSYEDGDGDANGSEPGWVRSGLVVAVLIGIAISSCVK